MYALIAVSCVIENFFPPSPSDTFVAMAAFLSHQGQYDPLAIFLTAWIAGIGGSAGIYYLVRRHADRLTDSRLGRLLLPPQATAFMLKEYGRYGAFGMVLTRLVPGFRSVVAPFAALSRLSLRQLLVPVGIATGLWYAMLTWVGARLGDQWDVVVGILNAINGALGVAAIVLAVLLVGGLLWWRRRRPAQ